MGAIDALLKRRVKQSVDEVPGQDALEFAPLARRLGGIPLEVLTQGLLATSLWALACAQIVVTAQAMDGMFVWLCGRTFAYAPLSPGGPWVESQVLSVMPFPKNTLGVSAGFAFDCCICVVLGCMDFSDNIAPQYVFFTLFCLALSGFIMHFINPDYDPMVFEEERLPMIGPDLSGVLGVVIFNYAYIVAVPSLYADCKPSSNFKAAMWGGVGFMWLMYTVYGVMGSTAFREVDGNFLLSVLRAEVPLFSKAAVFGLSFALQPSIPNYVILLSRCLREAGIPGSVIWANLAPWALAMFCYMQTWFAAIVNWSGLLVLGFMNYSIPLACVLLVYLDGAGPSVQNLSLFGKLAAAWNSSWELSRAIVYFIVMNILIVVCIAWNLRIATAFLFLEEERDEQQKSM